MQSNAVPSVHRMGRGTPGEVRLDHGAIGNGSVIALVSPTSSYDWLCMPRFDSGSVFGRLLDAERGGHFEVRGERGALVGRMRYVTNTNVLTTRFDDGAGNVWDVIDFAPRIPTGLSERAPIEVVRIVRPVAGVPRIVIDFDPRPDYAQGEVSVTPGQGGLIIASGANRFYLQTNMPVPYLVGRQVMSLRAPLYFAFGWGAMPAERSLPIVEQELQLTVDGWRMWARTVALPTYQGEAVLRSALCLKLHAYTPTGAIVAAATTSVPEALDTERTWDYRYCWLRDAAFVVEALRRIGHLAEGVSFIGYLRHVAEAGPLQPLYGIGGERELPEAFLPHLAGFAGNGHVRVGNAAALQQQNDLHGEIILCLETILGDPRIVLLDPNSYWPLVERLVEEAIGRAPLPDTGIWEFRSMLRHYTFSRAMCWVAADRGARIADRLGHPRAASRWRAFAKRERALILREGYHQGLGMFTQALRGEHPDAANLLFPTLNLIDARSPEFRSTLDVYERRLVRNGLMLRYCNDDDFGETTSAFTICSFWWAEALALSGQIDAAIERFEHVMSFVNPLLLFSEDIEPVSGHLLGNFPQAYTHVGLIHAAMTISDLKAARDGCVRAWM